MAKHVTENEKKALNERLEALLTADRSQLVRYWEKIYQKPPFPKMSSKLMRYAIAYKWQEKLYGGLKPATRRYLESVVRDTGMGKKPTAIATIKPGTRIIREWHGTTYEVIVQSEGSGVLLNGEYLNSLTEAAHRITGAKWSGPRFFGIVRGGGNAA